MSQLTVECPHCHQPFELTEALAAPLLEAERKRVDDDITKRVAAEREAAAKQAKASAEADYQKKLKATEATIAEKDAKLRAAQDAELAARKEREQLEQARRELDLTVQRRVDEAKALAAKQGAEQAAREFQLRLQAAETSLADKDAKLRAAQEAELLARKEREQLAQARQELDLTVQRRVDEAKEAAAKQAAEEAARQYKVKLQTVEASLAEKDAKLKAAETAELEARKLRQEAEEAKRQAELTVARRMDEERAKVREEAYRDRDSEHRLKLLEKDKQLNDMRQQIEELRRKGQTTSQQLAGDVLELDLLDVLRDAFPTDEFERIKKGQSGADILQTVRSRAGQVCGRILWESKRTKNWSHGWLAKLRDDQRAIKADLAALVSESLPEGVEHFDLVDNVWVTGIATAVDMAKAIRQGLVDVAHARRAVMGAETKKDVAYGYLTGPEFRQRVRGAIEPIIEMRADLEREKRSMNKQWSAREKQIERAAMSLAGMYGDLQGIVGASLPTVEGLSLPELEDSSATAALADSGAAASEAA